MDFRHSFPSATASNYLRSKSGKKRNNGKPGQRKMYSSASPCFKMFLFEQRLEHGWNLPSSHSSITRPSKLVAEELWSELKAPHTTLYGPKGYREKDARKGRRRRNRKSGVGSADYPEAHRCCRWVSRFSGGERKPNSSF